MIDFVNSIVDAAFPEAFADKAKLGNTSVSGYYRNRYNANNLGMVGISENVAAFTMAEKYLPTINVVGEILFCNDKQFEVIELVSNGNGVVTLLLKTRLKKDIWK